MTNDLQISNKVKSSGSAPESQHRKRLIVLRSSNPRRVTPVAVVTTEQRKAQLIPAKVPQRTASVHRALHARGLELEAAAAGERGRFDVPPLTLLFRPNPRRESRTLQLGGAPTSGWRIEVLDAGHD
jgi:hypothetical protein